MARTLIVCVPGLRLGVKSWEDMLKLLCAEPELAGANILPGEHGCSYLSTKYADALSDSLAAKIDGEWERAKHAESPYDNVILLGHSAGASLVRQAYLTGLGSSLRNAPSKDWSAKVTRIVLFAGLNRGLFPPEDPGTTKAPYRRLRWLGRHTIEFVSQIPLLHLLAEDLLAGSDFVTNLRIWWIRKLTEMANPPTVVQLVGTDDAIVRSTDSLDVEQDPAGNQIMIDGANHASVIQVKDRRGNLLEARYAQIRKAVLDPFPPSPSPVPKDEQLKPVIFVVHGIRASNGDWVKDASESIQAELPNSRIVPATYWYFSALDFALPLLRKKKIRWFMDTYSYYLARGPQASFHFLGHSNGTYLLGQSLRRLSGMQFDRVVLAGSVLPRTFNWQSHMDRRQVDEVWNHRASRDVPVAVLCNALRGLGMNDVGTGGFEGFSADPRIHECFYHQGNHSAALEKIPLVLLTEQVAGKSSPQAKCDHLVQGPSRSFARFSAMSFLLPYVVLVGILVFSYFIGVRLEPFVCKHLHQGLLVSCLIVGAFLLLLAAAVLEFL